jgi:TolA-binding protein
MSDTNDPKPAPESDDVRQGLINFDEYTRVTPGTGQTRQASMSEPQSGGSVVPWSELLKHQPHPGSEDEVALGSLPEIQIDAQSDNDIIKSLEREAASAGLRDKIAGKSSTRLKGPSPAKPAGHMPLAAKVFARQPSGSQAWVNNPSSGDSSIDLMTAAHDAANPSQDSSSGSNQDSSDVLAAAIQPLDDGTSRVNLGTEPRASITNSWKPPSPTPMPVLAMPRPARPKPPSRPTLRVRRPQMLTAWLGGSVAGAALFGAALSASGLIHRKQAPQVIERSQPPIVAAKPTAEQARRLLESGDLEASLAAFSEVDESPAVLAGRGQARWLNYLRQQKRQHAPLSERDAPVVAARKELVGSKSPEGSLWLGLINEAFGQFDAAREAYDLGHDSYPNRARLFAAARSRVDALTGGKKVAANFDPQLGLALSLVMMEAPAEAGGVVDEAGYDFWDAVTLARKGDFSAGRAALLKARAAHEQRRDLVVHRGANPDSDPRDDIFLHSCDQMLAWWDLQAKLQTAGFASQSPSQTFDALLGSQKKFDDAMKSLTATLRVDKADDIAGAIATLIDERKQAVERFKRADEALITARADLGKKNDELTEARKTATTELKKALAQEAEARKALEEVAAAKRHADDSFRSVHARLVKAKLVGEKADAADLVKALDTVLSTDINAKDAEIARLNGLLAEARRLPAVSTPAAAKADPDLAERLFSYGLQLYYDGKHAEAEEQFVAARQNNDRDARMLYFLGLSRLPQGKTAAADADFRKAVELERENSPDSRAVSAALERIQGPDRQIINRYRR